MKRGSKTLVSILKTFFSAKLANFLNFKTTGNCKLIIEKKFFNENFHKQYQFHKIMSAKSN